MKYDLVSKFDIYLGHLKFLFYKTVYKHHFQYGKNILCSGSVRIRCAEGKICISNKVKINSSTILHTAGSGKIFIKEGTGLSHRVILAAKDMIRIGRNVMIGPNVCVYDHDHKYKNGSIMMHSGFVTDKVIIHDNVWIGANCVILKGSCIGEGSVIAAGSIVKGNIPPNSLFYNERKCIIRSK